MQDKEYRDVPILPHGVRVSRDGDLIQFDRWKKAWVPKKATFNAYTGYMQVSRYWSHGQAVRTSLHRAVAAAWIENTCGYPEVNHIDGDKRNNSVENLEWCTRKYNAQHAFKNRRGEAMWSSKISELCANAILYDYMVNGMTQDQLDAKYQTKTQAICQRKGWKHIPMPPKPWAKNRQNVLAARLG
jgi:hypothetical protein